MKITRERKIIGSILILAMVGFGYDQCTTKPAEAQTTESESLLVSSASHKSSALSNADFSDPSLADRLAQLASDTKLADASQIRDVFHSGLDNTGETLSDSSRADAARKFPQAHQLTAVSTNAQGCGAAMVDGKMLQVGSKLDGFKLIAVNQKCATFDAGQGLLVQLKISSTSLASGR